MLYSMLYIYIYIHSIHNTVIHTTNNRKSNDAILFTTQFCTKPINFVYIY